MEKEIMQGTIPGTRRRGRPRTAWMDNIKTWTGLSVEESIRMTEDRDTWRKYVHGVANSRIQDSYRTEPNIPLCSQISRRKTTSTETDAQAWGKDCCIESLTYRLMACGSWQNRSSTLSITITSDGSYNVRICCSSDSFLGCSGICCRSTMQMLW